MTARRKGEAKPKKAHQVWVTFTVFVKAEGDKSPWYKHGRCETFTVAAGGHDQAFAIGERMLAADMAKRFLVAGS